MMPFFVGMMPFFVVVYPRAGALLLFDFPQNHPPKPHCPLLQLGRHGFTKTGDVNLMLFSLSASKALEKSNHRHKR